MSDNQRNAQQCDHIIVFGSIMYDSGFLAMQSEIDENGHCWSDDIDNYFKFCPECGQKLNPEENRARCEKRERT